MNFIKKKGLGIILCTAIAGVATLLAKIKIGSFSFEIIGAPVFAILIGMLITLIFPKFSKLDLLKEGIQFSSKKDIAMGCNNFRIFSKFSYNCSSRS